MKQPIGIFLTDTHLSKENISENFEIFRQVIEHALKMGLKRIYHLGDVFDSRKAQPLQVLTSFNEILQLLEQNGLVLHAIPGNHDKLNYESDDSYLDPFSTNPALRLYRLPNSILAENSDIINIHFMPYYKEETEYVRKMKLLKVNLNEKNILLTHCAITGVKNNDGTVVKNDLGKNDFAKFELVLVGHYHDCSKINNIYYIGSAIQHNFGEDQDKGFCVVYEDLTVDFIQADFKKYINVVIDLDDELSFKNWQITAEKNKGENLRFTFIGDQSKLAALDKSQFSEKGIDIKFKPKEITIGVEQAQNNEFISFDNHEIIKEFNIFTEEQKIEDKDFGINLLKEAIL